jgi:tetratricopeptide (TPR) repeat protein
LLLLAIAAPAPANTRSQQLYAKALIPFHAQRWQEAHQLLDDAARADPEDAVVAYYRGLTNARLGFPDKAIADIEHALALRPDLQPAVLDLGILYFQTGQYQLAQEWLQRAYAQPVNRFSAAFFLGLTQLRLGDPKSAQALLAEAAKDPNLRQSAQYYQALALLRTGDASEARALFEQVQLGPADTETAQIAKQYLAAPAAVAPVAERAWAVHGEAGFGYDSNVVLAPNSNSLVNCYTTVNGQCVPLNTKGEQDGFFALAFGARYRLFATDMGQGSIGYEFYQSVHFDTPSFDLQNNDVHLDLSTTRHGSFQFGVSGFYDFYLLDYASFYQQGRGVPWVTFFEGEVAATQVYYQLIGQDYLGSTNPTTGISPRNPFNPLRDAINNAVGARQFFLLGAADRFASIGYQWQDNDPISSDGTDFAYFSNTIDLRFDTGLFDWAHGTIGYAVDLPNYKHPNSRTDFTKRRHDVDNQIVVRCAHDITPYLSADIAYFGVINISNIPDFEYGRNIVEAGLRLHF